MCTLIGQNLLRRRRSQSGIVSDRRLRSRAVSGHRKKTGGHSVPDYAIRVVDTFQESPLIRETIYFRKPQNESRLIK